MTLVNRAQSVPSSPLPASARWVVPSSSQPYPSYSYRGVGTGAPPPIVTTVAPAEAAPTAAPLAVQPPPIPPPTQVNADVGVEVSELDRGLSGDALEQRVAWLETEYERWRELAAMMSSGEGATLAAHIQQLRRDGTSQVQSHQAAADALDRQSDELEARCAQVQRQIADAAERTAGLSDSVQELRQKLKATAASAAEGRAENASLNESLSKAEKELREASLDRPMDKVPALVAKNEAYKREISDLQARVSSSEALQEQIVAARERKLADELGVLRRLNRALRVEAETLRATRVDLSATAGAGYPGGVTLEQIR